MLIYLAWDGDHIGRKVGRASLNDDAEGLRRISQAIDRGNQIWKSWVENCGGSLISMGGDEGRAEIPADKLDELPKMREQYMSAVDATVSVGVGTKLSEADKALVAAKLQGGDRILFFTEEVDKIVAEAAKHGEKTEEQKITDEYLTKGAPAMNPGAFAGASRPSAPTVQKPVASQGDHAQEDQLYSIVNDENAPKPAEQTHAAKDFEHQLHEEAWKGHEEDMQAQHDQQRQQQRDHAKAVLVQALQVLKQQAPILDQLKQSAPQVYQAMIGLTQATIGLAKELAPSPDQPSAMAKAEPRITPKKLPKRADDGDIYQYMKQLHTGSGADFNKIPMDADFRLIDVPLKKLPSLRPPDNAHVQKYSKLKTPFPPIIIGRSGSIPDGHHRIAAARLRGDATIRAYVPVEELGVYGMAKPVRKAEGARYPRRMDDAQILDYFMTIHTGSRADFKRVPYDTEYEMRLLKVEDLVSGVPADNAIAAQYAKRETPFPPIIMKAEGTQPLDGNHRVTAARLRGDSTIRAYVPLSKSKPFDNSNEELGLHHLPKKMQQALLQHRDPGQLEAAIANMEPEIARHIGFGEYLWCDHAASLMHDVLKTHGVPHQRVVGENDIGDSHQWIRVAGKDYDATRQGFGDPAKAQVHMDHRPAMEKAGLPMPGAPAHHKVTLPSGSVVDQKVKVTHQDGKTSWRQVEAGQIRSQDPSGHPTSSRSPNAK